MARAPLNRRITLLQEATLGRQYGHASSQNRGSGESHARPGDGSVPGYEAAVRGYRARVGCEELRAKLHWTGGRARLSPVAPETHYARSGDVSIAYQVTGNGPFDVVWVQGFVSNVELAWQQPTLAAFCRQLASFCRLIRFDKRGTGMSDRVGVAALETRMDDVRAVMDAVGSPRAALLGSSEGGPLSLLFAASYPERTSALVLWSSFPRVTWASDYPWGISEQEAEDNLSETLSAWNDLDSMVKMVEGWAPDIDTESKLALASALRQSASPRDIEALERMNYELDVRHVLPAITAPTLVMNRVGEQSVTVEGSRYLAEHISGARHVQFPGVDHLIAAGDTQPILDEIRRFIEDASRSGEEAQPDRVLATVLFSDIVGSSEKAVALGDRVGGSC